MNLKGEIERFKFTVRSQRDWREIRRIAFDQGWRAMRDRFYDEAYNNKDWDAIRKKYRPVAAECLGAAEFSELMNMMLGELNASHMGHGGGSDPLPILTLKMNGRRRPIILASFDLQREGPGLHVESVIPGSPCSRSRSLVKAGESVLKIDGVDVGPDVDIEKLLTMEELTDVELVVRSAAGEERMSRSGPHHRSEDCCMRNGLKIRGRKSRSFLTASSVICTSKE